MRWTPDLLLGLFDLVDCTIEKIVVALAWQYFDKSSLGVIYGISGPSTRVDVLSVFTEAEGHFFCIPMLPWSLVPCASLNTLATPSEIATPEDLFVVWLKGYKQGTELSLCTAGIKLNLSKWLLRYTALCDILHHIHDSYTTLLNMCILLSKSNQFSCQKTRVFFSQLSISLHPGLKL